MYWMRASSERQVLARGGATLRRAFNPAAEHPSQREFGVLRAIDELLLPPGLTSVEHQPAGNETVLLVRRGAAEVVQAEWPGCRVEAGSLMAVSGAAGATFRVTAAAAHEAAALVRVELAGSTRERAPTLFTPQGAAELHVVASHHGVQGGLPLECDAQVRWVRLAAGRATHVTVETGRRAWVQLLDGAASILSAELQAGDGAAFEDEAKLEVRARTDAELLVIDVEDTGDQRLWNGD